MSRSSILYVEGDSNATLKQIENFFIKWSSKEQIFRIDCVSDNEFFGYFELCSSGGVSELDQMESLKDQLIEEFDMKNIMMNCWSLHCDDAMFTLYQDEDSSHLSEKSSEDNK